MGQVGLREESECEKIDCLAFYLDTEASELAILSPHPPCSSSMACEFERTLNNIYRKRE